MTNSFDLVASTIVVGISVIGFLFIVFVEIARLIKKRIISKEYSKIKETRKVEIEVIKEKIEALPREIERLNKAIKDNMRLTEVISIHFQDKLEGHMQAIDYHKRSLKDSIEHLAYYKNKLATLEFEENESELSLLMYVDEKYNTGYTYISRDTHQTKLSIRG